jgi:predicted secreted Zn-dependent protease
MQPYGSQSNMDPRIHAAILHAIEAGNAGQREEALRVLQVVVERVPYQVKAWKWLAHFETDPERAYEAVQRVMVLNPGDLWAVEALPIYRARAGLPPVEAAAATQPRRFNPMLIIAIMLSLLVGGGSILWGVAGGLRSGRTIEDIRGLTLLEPTPPATDARVVTNISSQYYQFKASNTAEIQEGLFVHGPTANPGVGPHPIASTSYVFDVDSSMRETLRSCTLVDATVHLDIVYTYPNWVPSGSPNPRLYDEWYVFFQRVVQHEETHARIAIECAATLADRMEALGSYPTCTELQLVFDDTMRRTFDECEERQAGFDEVDGFISFPLQ